MEEKIITFETAKLAKEKGFPQKEITMLEFDRFYKMIDGRRATIHDELPDIHERGENLYAPTQALLQKWLREEHGILVLIDVDWFNLIWVVYVSDHEFPLKFISEENYKTYEEALEVGLQKGLEQI